MSIRGDTTYQVTCRLELAKHRFLNWNCLEVGDIFRQIEQVEADIVKMQ